MTPQQAGRRRPLHSRVGRSLVGLILWKHERGSWQYDVMVGLILLFVFLTPVGFFGDQPTLGRDVVRMGEDADGVCYRVSSALLSIYDDDPRKAAEELFALQLDHPFVLTRIEPVRDQENDIIWYDIWARGRSESGP